LPRGWADLAARRRITIEFIGLTEVILAITMIIFLITKPKGLFAFHETGDTIKTIFVKKKD